MKEEPQREPEEFDAEQASALSRAVSREASDTLGQIQDTFSKLAGDQLKGFRGLAGKGFRRDLFEDVEKASVFRSLEPPIFNTAPFDIDLSDIPIDTSPQETAENTARAAAAAERQAQSIEKLIELTALNLAASNDQREQATRSERFTRIMAWSSLGVAIASLGAAVVAIVVSL